jgi:DNA-binding LytR/AlgR family response regulator
MKYTTPLVRPAGCLLKPVKREDVCYAIDSVIQDMRNGEEKSDVFQFKIRSREYYLDCEQIIMFEAACKKIVLYTDVQEYEFYESINHIMEVLPSYFVRSHKSYIINMHRVLEVNYKELTILLENNLVANLSRNLKNDFSEKINNYK